MFRRQLSNGLRSAQQQVVAKRQLFKFTLKFVFHIVKGYQPVRGKNYMIVKLMKFFDRKNRNDEHVIK